MKGVVEIRWHGRCGQGTATAARLTAGSASRLGMYFQAFPAFLDDAPPRSGEPVVAYTRISDQPIRVHSEVTHPFMVAVLDASLLADGDVTRGARGDGIVLVNTALLPAELRRRYHLKGRRLYCVDAARIACETTDSQYPNTSILGALARVTDLMPVASVVDYLRDDFGRRLPKEVVEANVAAVRRAHAEVMAEGERVEPRAPAVASG